MVVLFMHTRILFVNDTPSVNHNKSLREAARIRQKLGKTERAQSGLGTGCPDAPIGGKFQHPCRRDSGYNCRWHKFRDMAGPVQRNVSTRQKRSKICLRREALRLLEREPSPDMARRKRRLFTAFCYRRYAQDKYRDERYQRGLPILVPSR